VAPFIDSTTVGLLYVTMYVNFVCSKQEGYVTADAGGNDDDIMPTIQTYRKASLTTSGNVPTMLHFASLFS
jgi:hypothetical protein